MASPQRGLGTWLVPRPFARPSREEQDAHRRAEWQRQADDAERVGLPRWPVPDRQPCRPSHKRHWQEAVAAAIRRGPLDAAVTRDIPSWWSPGKPLALSEAQVAELLNKSAVAEREPQVVPCGDEHPVTQPKKQRHQWHDDVKQWFLLFADAQARKGIYGKLENYGKSMGKPYKSIENCRDP